MLRLVAVASDRFQGGRIGLQSVEQVDGRLGTLALSLKTKGRAFTW